ncbi:translation initiation factor IF-5A [Candidatus Pacearchaeota archaeon]|nr:translation initiation factor IF-5A [Candidatus Pacearchaeota archaeon]MBD3283704.1 translation initiation factor IF-5A [Candidatus Pacearchaeota archaeon]
MAFKLISASAAKSGTAIMVDGVPCIVKSNDISKTGKHGHAKCRIEAVGIIDNKKRVFVKGGHERLEVPMINKNRGQVLSIMREKASVMDLENYETIEIDVPEELREQIKEEDQVEYWDIEGSKIIKRKL